MNTRLIARCTGPRPFDGACGFLRRFGWCGHFVMACRFDAVGRDGPDRVLDCCGRLSERHHLPALQQPDQAGLVIAGQAAVARMWLRGWHLEPEQVASGPTERLGLLSPTG